MAGKATYFQNAVLNVLRNTTVTGLANTYVALYTVTPSNAGGGTEMSGGGYARVAVPSTGWSAPATSGQTQQIANNAVVDFGTVGWSGTIVAFGICDAATTGNLLYWGPLTASKTVNIGDPTNFPIGTLVVSEQ